MRKLLVISLLLLAAAVAVAAASRWWRAEEPEWTTDSPQALAELEAGHEALQKLYFADAAQHFWRALDHDPDLVVAKVRAVQLGNVPARHERIAELLEEVRAADLAELTARERLLVRYLLARIDRDGDEATAVLDAYLAEHPDDPYAIELACGAAYAAGDLDEAERCNQRLIELDPNRVAAQNMLGYLAMARGDFTTAEERFAVYRYVAPDQANPHDSLGELYLLTGRDDDAEEEFERAIAAKSDFCASWENLVLVELLRGDFVAAGARVEAARQAAACGESTLAVLACRVELWRAASREEPASVLAGSEECGEDAGELLVLRAWAAWSAGRDEEALGIEEEMETFAGEEAAAQAALDHLVGLRLLHGGEPAGAVERFRAADGNAHYRSQQWLFKLANRQALAAALTAAGRPDEAADVRREIAAVNPRFADSRPLFGLEGVGHR